MEIKTIKEEELAGKIIVYRVDFNCPIENGKVLDDYRIKRTMPSVKYLVEQGVEKVIMMAHLGRPEGKWNKDFSLAPVVDNFRDKLKQELGDQAAVRLLEFNEDVEKCLAAGKEASEKLVFLENIRFWPGDEAEDKEFAKKLASAGDLFVSDAFGVAHRVHASVAGVAEFLPAAAGLLMEEEVSSLDRAIKDPARPAIAVVGGAKLETKIPVLETLAKNYDQLLVGGLVAVKLEEEEGKAVREKLPAEKLVLPDGYADEQKRDIDEATAKKFATEIAKAKTILWNGPMGMFENPPFDKGSRIVAQAIADSEAFKVTGGGETNDLLAEFGIFDKMDFVSTGGGAMLDWIAGKPLPGVEIFRK